MPIEVARNYVPETAPVSFPAIWDTPYFDRVLYNAAIRQPLARNVIEALGVQAPIDHATISPIDASMASISTASGGAKERSWI